MSEEYEVQLKISRRKAQILHFCFDLLPMKLSSGAEEIVEVVGDEFDPELTRSELLEVLGQFLVEVKQVLPQWQEPLPEDNRILTFSLRVSDRRAKILRVTFDYFGSTVLPYLTDDVLRQLGCSFPENELAATYLVFWCVVDTKFPQPDGTFRLEDLETAWDLDL